MNVLDALHRVFNSLMACGMKLSLSLVLLALVPVSCWLHPIKQSIIQHYETTTHLRTPGRSLRGRFDPERRSSARPAPSHAPPAGERTPSLLYLYLYMERRLWRTGLVRWCSETR